MQAKVDFDKATTNVGTKAALAVAWKGHTDSMQVLVHFFAKVEPELHQLAVHKYTKVVKHKRKSNTSRRL